MEKDTVTTPYVTVKNHNITSTPSTTTLQSQKHPARIARSSDRNQVLKKNKTEDSP